MYMNIYIFLNIYIYRFLLNSELMSCVKVEVAVFGSLFLIVRAVCVNVKQH